jgi:hypothetical protein
MVAAVLESQAELMRKSGRETQASSYLERARDVQKL